MKPEIKYGLLASLLSIICLYGGYKFIGSSALLLVWVVFIIMLVLAIRERKKLQGGFLELSDGMKTGLGVAGISGLIFSIAVYIYFKWVVPDLMLAYAEKAKTYLESQGATAEEIKNRLVDFDPSRQAVMTLSFMIVSGAIITLIISLVMKKRPA
jgi:hypothetical protein